MSRGTKPKHVDGQIAIRTRYYRQRLRLLVKGIWEIECPDTWDKDYFLNLLLFGGYFAVLDTSAGVLPLRSSTYGINFFGNPVSIRVAVPTLPQMERTIGVDCELVYMERTPQKSYWNFSETIRIYAEQLASVDCGISVNLLNTQLGHIAEAETKAQAETIKSAFDELANGEPLVVYREGSLNPEGIQMFFNNVRNTFIVPELQDAKRTILNEFLTTIGVNNANTDKKERLIVPEANSNMNELTCNMSYIQERLDECCDRVNKMFPGTDLKFKFRFDQSNIEQALMAEGGINSDPTRRSRDVGGKS